MMESEAQQLRSERDRAVADLRATEARLQASRQACEQLRGEREQNRAAAVAASMTAERALSRLVELQPLVDAAIAYSNGDYDGRASVLDAARDYAGVVRRRS